MAIESGFFNSVNNDRLYNARDISRYFENILSSGIFKRITNCLQVSAASGMGITVAPGAGLIESQWFRASEAQALTVPAAHAVLPRIDNVVARLDFSEEVRAITLMVVSGTPADSPQAAAPVRTATVYDLILARVLVPAGASAIAADNITDTRANAEICGYVQSLVHDPVLKAFNSRYEAAANNVTSIPINIVGLNYGVDILNVHINGFKLASGVEYTVNADRGTITLAEAVDAGTIVDFEAYKPFMPDDIPDLADMVTDMAQAVTTLQAKVEALEADTGWINLAWASGITSNDNWQPRLRRVGKSIYLRGLCMGVNAIDKQILTIPDGYRPTQGGHAYVAYCSSNNNTRAARMFIDENGAVIVRSTEGGAPTGNDVITVSTSWLID